MQVLWKQFASIQASCVQSGFRQWRVSMQDALHDSHIATYRLHWIARCVIDRHIWKDRWLTRSVGLHRQTFLNIRTLVHRVKAKNFVQQFEHNVSFRMMTISIIPILSFVNTTSTCCSASSWAASITDALERGPCSQWEYVEIHALFATCFTFHRPRKDGVKPEHSASKSWTRTAGVRGECVTTWPPVHQYLWYLWLLWYRIQSVYAMGFSRAVTYFAYIATNY